MKQKKWPVALAIILCVLSLVCTIGSIVEESISKARLRSEAEKLLEKIVELENAVTTVPVEEAVQIAPTVVDNPVDDVDNSVEVSEPEYTQEELDILAIIIYQEAGGDGSSDDTRRKVGSVFLNRVAHPKFPDTFEAVATAKRQYGTLYWKGIKWPDRASSAGEAHAVERAYRIAEELLTTGSILPSNVIWQAEFKQGNGVYCYQDGLYFCYSGGI